MPKISERLKLWMSSRMLVYPHLQVQDASRGSVESMRSALADSLLTRHESITGTGAYQSSGADHLDLPLRPLSEPPPDPHSHVQNDGDEYHDEEIPEEDFWVSLDLSYVYSISLNQNIRQKMIVQHFNVCQIFLINLQNFSNIVLQYFPGRAIPHPHP
jgi:hypothetical protein